MAAAIGIAKTATEIFLGVGEVSIDNLTFKLHYKWSVTLFIVCSVLVQTSQFFGDPVQCETAEDSVDDDVLNSFCWMYSSFDMPSTFKFPCTRKTPYDGNHDTTYLYNTYYQWVSIFLAFQAGLFYIPRCIWLIMEGGLMAFIVNESDIPRRTTGRIVDRSEEKISEMLKHFQEHVHNKFNRYALGFFACELANVCLSILSVFLTHKFLLNSYILYGLNVYRYYSLEAEERKLQGLLDPMCEVFPKIAACRYHRYGMGGGVEDRHSICILGLNMINDKVFVILWFWHCFIVFIGSIRIITRTSQVTSSKIRYFLLRTRLKRYLKNNAHTQHIQHYVTHCSIGDWFVLYQMSKNLNQRFFAEYITVLSMTIDPDPNIEPEEPELYLNEEELERRRNPLASTSRRSSRKDSTISRTSDGSGSSSEGDEGEDEDEEGGARRGGGNLLLKIDSDLDEGGGGSGLSGKQKNLMKAGRSGGKVKAKANQAASALKRIRSRR